MKVLQKNWKALTLYVALKLALAVFESTEECSRVVQSKPIAVVDAKKNHKNSFATYVSSLLCKVFSVIYVN